MATSTTLGGTRCQTCEHRVPGLHHICGFLDSEQQEQLLALIDLEGFFEIGNQVMIFGAADIPTWCAELTLRFPVHLFPEEIRCRQPLFDQMILNRYQPGEGLNPHTDLLRFKDGICVASLGSSAILKFTEPSLEAEHKVFMDAGDLILMHGSARYDWQHGIPDTAVDTWVDGRQRARSVRTSLTFRALDTSTC